LNDHELIDLFWATPDFLKRGRYSVGTIPVTDCVAMTSFNTQLQTLELHQVKRPFMAIRTPSAKRFTKLLNQFTQHAQQSPVIVSHDEQHPYQLIDGYLRYHVLKTLHQDTLWAEVWLCDPLTALVQYLSRSESRSLSALERALWIRQLQTDYQLSQRELAIRLQREQSWVSRQLSLIDALPDQAVATIQSGHLSLWAASRVIVPMARAIPTHAKQLLNYLATKKLSTRELNAFYNHYLTVPRSVKERMLNDLALCFKSLAQRRTRPSDTSNGPEEQWQHHLQQIEHALQRLTALIPALFAPAVPTSEQRTLRTAVAACQRQFTTFYQQLPEIPHDQTTTT